MRIGIFGGTFNPVHKGHVLLAQRAIDCASLDKLLIIPDRTPPHKSSQTLATAADRLEMCRIAFSGNERIFVSDIEHQREGKSYSIDTLTDLKRLYPDDELIMLVGSDMLMSFDRWYRWRDILCLCTLCAFERDEKCTAQRMKSYAKEVLELDADKGEIIISKAQPLEVSSTLLRELLLSGGDTEALLDSRVREYIDRKKVYFPDTDRADEFKALAEKMLRADRCQHSFNVADSAAYLARLYGADERTAYCAGLLHDITKHTAAEKQLQLLQNAGVSMTAVEKANESLWHAMSAAAFIEYELNIKSRDIINAVRYHTTGRAGMSLLERIVYTADFISAERSYPDVDTMRSLSAESLDKADLYALKFCIGRLASTGKVIHPDSIDFYNELAAASVSVNNTESQQ